MSSEQRGSNLSTTALYVGVPVILGASCYYLYYVNKNKNSQSGANSKDATDKNKAKTKQLTPKEQLAQLKQNGNRNFQRKNYDIAIDSYTRAIEFSKTLSADDVKPDDLAIFYQNRAACNEALGHYDKVISDCDSAIKLKNNYVKAYVRRAKAYEKMQNYDKALVDAYSASLLDKFQNQANMILTENIAKASSKAKAAKAMEGRAPTWPANQTIKSYFSAFTHDPLKDKLNNPVTITAELLEQLMEEAKRTENDDDAFSLLVRGSCQSLMNELKAAHESFDKLLSLDDEKCPPRYKANALIKKAAIIISDPSNGTSSIERDLESVSELLERAIKIDPENPDIYLHKSQALSLSEKLEEAVLTLNKAIELKKNFHSAIAQKFYLEFKMATRDPSTNILKLQDLLGQFKQAVKENPESVDLHQMYAQVLTEMSYFEQADQVLLDMAKLDPTDGNIHVSRALLQFHIKNDPDEVANLMLEALKIDPKILFAYEILGSIETQRGKIDEAIDIFRTALKYAQSEAEYARCYSLLDSAISQKTAAELLGMQV